MEIFSMRDPRLKRSFDIRVNSPIIINFNITLILIILRHHRLWNKLQLPVVLITARILSSVCTNKYQACLKRINKLKTSPDWGKILLWSSRSMFMKDRETKWWLSKRLNSNKCNLSIILQQLRQNSTVHNSKQRSKSPLEPITKSSRPVVIFRRVSNCFQTQEWN